MRTIRRCIESGAFQVAHHFVERMDQRGLFWPDVLAVVDDPVDVRDGGPETWGRPKWIVAGHSATHDDIEVVCVVDRDELGELTVFITLY